MTKNIKVDRAIHKAIDSKKKLLIFPFGEEGVYVKNVLNHRYGIAEAGIFDNELCKYNSKIYPLSKLREYNKGEVLVLLCSTNEEIYSDVRYSLMEYIDIDDFVDVFSHSMFFDSEAYYDKPTQRHQRLVALEYSAKEIYKNGVKGAIAECGVYKGWFANYMSRYMPDRKLYLFDTFSGFDARDIDQTEESDSGKFRSEFALTDTSAEIALSHIGYRKNAIIRKGWFPDTTQGLENETFAFVSLDTDLYKPIYEGLTFFYPRLESGGYIFVDDFGHQGLLGVRKAVVDFCKENHVSYVSAYDGTDSTAIISKQ